MFTKLGDVSSFIHACAIVNLVLLPVLLCHLRATGNCIQIPYMHKHIWPINLIQILMCYYFAVVPLLHH